MWIKSIFHLFAANCLLPHFISSPLFFFDNTYQDTLAHSVFSRFKNINGELHVQISYTRFTYPSHTHAPQLHQFLYYYVKRNPRGSCTETCIKHAFLHAIHHFHGGSSDFFFPFYCSNKVVNPFEHSPSPFFALSSPWMELDRQTTLIYPNCKGCWYEELRNERWNT